MNEDRCVSDPLQFRRSPDMVYMTVGDEDKTNLYPVPGNLFDDPEDLVAWINDNPFHRILASQNVAIGLVRTDDKLSEQFVYLQKSKP